MATRILGPTGSKRRWRFRFLTLPILLAAALALFMAGGAQAVHSLGVFQLDSAIAPTSAPTGGANAQQFLHPAGVTGDDWDNICASNLAPNGLPDGTGTGVGDMSCKFVSPKDSNTSTSPSTTATSSTWADDRAVKSGVCAGGDNCTVFTTGGSKDIADLSSWQWKTDSGGLPKKDNLQQAFAARYTTAASTNCPNISGGTTCSLAYFGSTRMANNGDAQQGFWFLQNKTGTNPDGSGSFCTVGSTGTCSGPAAHKAGDVLIASDFSVGGATALIGVYEWVDATCGTTGVTVCSASDFPGDVSTNIKSLGGTPAGGTALCGFAPSTDDRKFCGVVNFADGTISPWPFLDAAGNTNFLSGELYEAGINLSAFPGIANECFATLAAESRASAGNASGTSISATLKDFVLSNFGNCTSELHTTANGPTGDGTIGTGTVSSGTDSANLTVSGASSWTGTLKFYLCGPIATGTCDSHGVLVSTINNVNQSTSQPIASGNGTTTGFANLTSAGRYCWFGQFISGTTGVPNASDDGTPVPPATTNKECFTVTPVTPTLATAAVAAASGLSPTIYGHLADMNGSGTVTSADNSTAFYKNTNIINGGLDCNNWSTPNAGTAGDGVINGSDNCTLIGYDGTADGVTIQVLGGQFVTADGNNIADGTPLPTVFNATNPNDSSVVDADFAWSTILGRVDTNGDGVINQFDCSNNVVDSYSVLGSDCGNTIPQGNGLVDLNGSGTITSADTCNNGCFLGHNVSVGYVLAGSVPLGSTLYDFASLTGTANNPNNDAAGGDTGLYKSINGSTKPADSTINWTLYAPGGVPAGCFNTKVTAPASVTVSGDGTYGPTSYTTTTSDAVGTYTFVATYGGESPNTNAATPTSCPDTSGTEKIIVFGSASSSSKQRWLPNDRVTLTSTVGTTLTGTLTVTLYHGTFSGTAGNCTAGLDTTAVSGQSYTFTPSGDASGSVYQTSNTDPATGTHTTFYVGSNPDGSAGGAAGSYFWLIHYHDNNLTSPTDRCETSTVSPITDG